MCEADLDLERLVGGTSASSMERERRRFVATAGSASTSGKEQDWEGLGVEVAVKGGGSESVKKETVDLPEELADTGLRGSERDSVAIRRLGTLQRPRGLLPVCHGRNEVHPSCKECRAIKSQTI